MFPYYWIERVNASRYIYSFIAIETLYLLLFFIMSLPFCIRWCEGNMRHKCECGHVCHNIGSWCNTISVEEDVYETKNVPITISEPIYETKVVQKKVSSEIFDKYIEQRVTRSVVIEFQDEEQYTQKSVGATSMERVPVYKTVEEVTDEEKKFIVGYQNVTKKQTVRNKIGRQFVQKSCRCTQCDCKGCNAKRTKVAAIFYCCSTCVRLIFTLVAFFYSLGTFLREQKHEWLDVLFYASIANVIAGLTVIFWICMCFSCKMKVFDDCCRPKGNAYDEL
jgi:predicted transcriptional regulator